MNRLSLTLLPLIVVATVNCGKQSPSVSTNGTQSEAALTLGVAGRAPAGTTDVFAASASAGTISSKPDATGRFRIELTRGKTWVVSFAAAGKVLSTLTFAANASGARTNLLPAPREASFTGQAETGDVELGDVDETAAGQAEPEKNPLDAIDSDGDGTADRSDDDDDDDGEKDDEDSDREGDGEDDDSQDFDTDDDGATNAVNNDDDNDGMSDEDDSDDDNDGLEDESDEDEDGTEHGGDDGSDGEGD